MSGPISKQLISLTLVLLALPLFVFATVSQISFTTDPQTVKPGDISGTLAVQLQDSTGASNPSAETVDIEFLSTSVSGEFLSPSSGSPVTKTISTGSANKNFRYRDSAEGVFTLTINAKGRTSGLSWSTTQNITVANSTSATTTSSTSTPSSATTTTSQTTISTSTSSNNLITPHTGYTYTVYYSSIPLSSFQESKTVEVSAGRDRLGTVGSPLEFKAQTNLPYTRNTSFKWNFGDGTQTEGEIVMHTYEYSGEYVVMLNSSSPEGQAIARANVKIIKPDLSIAAADGDKIAVINNSNQEISLFGRVLWSQGKTFVFPQDTIIRNGQTITFGSKVTDLHPSSQQDVHLLVVGGTESAKIGAKIEEKRAEEIAYLGTQIADLQSQLAFLPTAEVEDQTVATPPVATASSATPTKLPIEPQAEVAAATKSGWWDFIKHFFLRNKK